MRAAVSARLGYDPFFDRAPETVFVEIQRHSHAFALVVKLIDANHKQRGARAMSVKGDDCSAVIDAIGLSVSLAIDPATVTGSPPPAPPAPPLPAPAPATADPMRVAAPDADAMVTPATKAPTLRSDSAVFFPHVGLGTFGSANAVPAATAGATVMVGVGWRALSVDLEGQVDAPATGDSALPPLQVRSWLMAATLVPCFHVGTMFGCPVVSVGRFTATARNVRSAVENHGPWSALGGRVGGEWTLRARLSMQVYGQVLATMTRDTLWVDWIPVYTVPAWSAGLGLALAWRFR